ncbi:uncharacterized protein LOC115879704 [Sitophilus oryzae]|uniref:Uncharacterized protein LOC115879704 n=1 Tax=Sitophilus oryzae TaxID=7048 RepID=A0A6J2XN76_SITOR|nr:uncharacterized protein LOC115879704 [Sitophilus oryzae]
MRLYEFSLLLILFLSILNTKNGVLGDYDLDRDIKRQLGNENQTQLSRKRRYLVFPAGSSFQLVFCLTFPSVGMGSLFVFGNTAALAWELPSTPIYFNSKDFEKKDEEPETTTVEIPHDIDLDALSHDDHHDHDRASYNYAPWSSPLRKFDNGYTNWFQSNSFRTPVNSYSNPFTNFVENKAPNRMTPAYGRYGYKSKKEIEGTGRRYDRPNMDRYVKKTPVTSYVDPIYHHIHRRTRRDLYQKLETFLYALNLDGKTCLLKAICEITKSPKSKGSFIEEVLKVIFRAKPHDNYPDEDKYDNAANTEHNCNKMYPACKGSLLSNILTVSQ